MSEAVKKISVRVQLLQTLEGFKIAIRCPLCNQDIVFSFADLLAYIQSCLGDKNEPKWNGVV